jgi:serine/threonine protein kinase
LKLIASGTSGAVYLARVKSTSELVAIKVIKKEGRSDTHLQFAVREQQVQNAVMGDDKFTTLVASWHDENNFYIVTVCTPPASSFSVIIVSDVYLCPQKYCPGGDLAIELIRCPIFDAARAQFYAAEMVSNSPLSEGQDCQCSLNDVLDTRN